MATTSKAKSEEILAQLSPSVTTYRNYRWQADRFLATFAGPSPIEAASQGRITAMGMRKSIIFNRGYLVAHADPTWFHRTFPGTNAAATDSLTLERRLYPPLVLVPDIKKGGRGRDFLSILEHEFVHISQILAKTFPHFPPGTARGLVKWVFAATRAEYEANLLQLVRWPRLYTLSGKKHGLSLESWCAFRGYTQALERIIHATAMDQIDRAAFLGFIGRLPGALPTAFQRMEFDTKLGEYCAANTTWHATTAMHLLAKGAPSLWPSLRHLWQEMVKRGRNSIRTSDGSSRRYS